MSSHMDFYIDNMTDDEIMDLYKEFVVEPKSGESQDEFVSRCIILRLMMDMTHHRQLFVILNGKICLLIKKS